MRSEKFCHIAIAGGVILGAFGGFGAWYFDKNPHHTYEMLSHITVTVGGILTALAVLGAWHLGKKAATTPATKEDINDAIRAHLGVLFNNLQGRSSRITQKYPGLSCHMVVSLQRLADNRRKFLLDIGRNQKNRISLYLDTADFLCFRLIDVQGEIQTVKVSPSPSTFEFDRTLYIACDIGNTGNSSFLRLLLDGNEVATQQMPYGLDLPPLDIKRATLGADFRGKNGGRFNMAEIVIYSNTLTTDEMEKLLGYLTQQPRKQWVVFGGSHFMKIADREAKNLP